MLEIWINNIQVHHRSFINSLKTVPKRKTVKKAFLWKQAFVLKGMSIISTFDVESLLQLHQGRQEHLSNCQKGWTGGAFSAHTKGARKHDSVLLCITFSSFIFQSTMPFSAMEKYLSCYLRSLQHKYLQHCSFFLFSRSLIFTSPHWKHIALA